MTATIPDLQPEIPRAPVATVRAGDDLSVLVGWSHAPFSRGIQLKLQSTIAGSRDKTDIAAHNYLMTRNQALILAKYLLDVTGQSLPKIAREGTIKRFLRRLTGG
ncbi:MAG: hypothetical protein V4579_13220 [Pseudomonadota bacterium]